MASNTTSNSKNITRKELYLLIWKTPITTISKNYNIPDSVIRDICKKLEIPTPTSGYWIKLKFKKTVVIPPLPKIKNDNKETGLKLVDEKLIYEEHFQTALSRIKKEIKNATNISYKVPSKLTKPHKFSKATSIYHQKVKIRNKNRDWSTKIDTSNVLSIDVSDKLFPRALRLMDTLIKIFEKRGYGVKLTGSTEITIKGQSYSIRITEKNKRVKRETNNSWDSFDLVPTGNLSLKIDRSYPIKEWSDSKTKLLEDKLIDILTWLELRVKKDEEQRIASEKWNREYEKQRKIEEERKQRFDKEVEKFNNLKLNSKRFQETEQIRNYIKAIETNAINNNTLTEELETWIKWANQKADWYDPIIQKEDKFFTKSSNWK